MKLICDGLELSDAIGKVSKALPQRVVNPVLEGIKITAEGETLTLYATDSEFSVERKINAEIIEEEKYSCREEFFPIISKSLPTSR